MISIIIITVVALVAVDCRRLCAGRWLWVLRRWWCCFWWAGSFGVAGRLRSWLPRGRRKGRGLFGWLGTYLGWVGF